MKDNEIKLTGKVTQVLGHGKYAVTIEGGYIVECQLAGKLTQMKISIILGDEVDIIISSYETATIPLNKAKGRVTWRHRKK